jgi:hypothetical protein
MPAWMNESNNSNWLERCDQRDRQPGSGSA